MTRNLHQLHSFVSLPNIFISLRILSLEICSIAYEIQTFLPFSKLLLFTSPHSQKEHNPKVNPCLPSPSPLMSSSGGEASWRSSFSDTERATVIEKLTRILLSISSSSEQNTERIQQIALRFESQVYTAAGHKAEYYQIISNKISSIAEKKRIILNYSGNVSTGGIPSNVTASGASQTTGTTTTSSFQENSVSISNSTSIPGSPAVSNAFSRPFSSSNVPNPQMLLMNTLGKGINQQQPIKESSIYSSTPTSAVADTSSNKNPFIPAIPLSSKPQIHIPNGKLSSNSSNSSFQSSSNSNNSSFQPSSNSGNSSFQISSPLSLNANASSFHSVSPASASSHSSIQTSFPQPSIHLAQQAQKMQFHPVAVNHHHTHQQQSTSQNEKLYAGSLPNLTLNSEEKNAVKKLIESLKAFIPKIEILVTVSNSIGIPMENLKKISNLKDILAKQLELFKSDIYLLSPFMAENLAEHIRKFVSLLLHKVNSHPAAQSIIEKIRKASEANGATSSNAASTANSILPSPLSALSNVPFGSNNSNSVKKGNSPPASATSLPTATVIRESPFKAPVTTSNQNGNSTSNNHLNVKKQSNRTNSFSSSQTSFSTASSSYSNSLLDTIPTLGYMKAKCKRKASVPIEYLKSQLQFIRETALTEQESSAGNISIEPAVKRLRETFNAK